MIRRSRRVREIPFSFDSFLDIVANVVGIIIRLILVVWVSARTYGSIHKTEQAWPESLPTERAAADPQRAELARRRAALANAEARLLAQLRELQQFRCEASQTRERLAILVSRRTSLEQEQALLTGRVRENAQAARDAALSSEELRQRITRLGDEIHALEQLPPLTHALLYRTPVSHPVASEEVHFECLRGRVTFIDLAALLGDVRQGLEDKGKLLRNQWQWNDVTGPVGAFRLRYTVERERGLLDALGGEAGPGDRGGFRYGVSAWQVEPIALARGETAEEALARSSEFRRVVEGLDSRETVVTFWVYPDSFGLFRRLRDVLYEQDVVVAGRPLPEGLPIASSRRGTASRGQ
jgi:hypothetical protein